VEGPRGGSLLTDGFSIDPLHMNVVFISCLLITLCPSSVRAFSISPAKNFTQV
jgi:hypothetical protein